MPNACVYDSLVASGGRENLIEYVVKPYGIHKFRSTITDFTLSPVRDAPSQAPVVIDLRGVTFVRPSMLVLLRAFVDLLMAGDPARGIPPRREIAARLPKSRNVRTSVEAMNLFGRVRTKEPSKEESDALHIPLRALTTSDESETIAAQLKNLVVALAKRDIASAELQRVSQAIGTILGELLENFRKHSEAARPGFACAQDYRPNEYRDEGAHPRRRRGFFELAVADTGIGIRRSLERVRVHAEAIAAGTNPCELAARFGVTSKPGVHGGYGLWVSKRLCERSGGAFKLASENFALSSSRSASGRGRASLRRLTGRARSLHSE